MQAQKAEVGGLWERTRRTMQTNIAATAMELFLAQGFDNVTVSEIATEVGVSSRSLYRYFGTKEDMALGHLADSGRKVKAALEVRPAAEAPWDALVAALHVLEDDPAYSPERALKISTMFYETPSLRARQFEKRLQWVELLLPNVEQRLGIEPGPVPDPGAHAIVSSILSCLDTATEIWVRRKGAGDLTQIFMAAVTAVRDSSR
ncbi:TetR family transcriptional regulator [Streptomyces misionensis]|uniref:TetR/AcrR family transcriptional regulator n=1 Tax=Streptomyces misionensis TaxID=67331 RepID=UPI0033D043C1